MLGELTSGKRACLRQACHTNLADIENRHPAFFERSASMVTELR
jgi:hypothetical protein